MLMVIIVATVLAIAVASVLSYSLNSLRNSERQALLEQAKLVADSELEYLFIRWKQAVRAGLPTGDVTTTFASEGYIVETFAELTTDLPRPYESSMNTAGWRVSRFLEKTPISASADGSAFGTLSTSSETGKNFYFRALTRATKQDRRFGQIEFRAARRFVYSEASAFNSAMLYNGDLELSPGSDMKVYGPITANGAIYMGSQNGVTLYIASNVKYLSTFNGGSPTNEVYTTYRMPGVGGSTSALQAPVFDPNPDDGSRPDQEEQFKAQVSQLKQAVNFLGGIDYAQVLADYPAAYTDESGEGSANEIFRSIIAPPPRDSSNVLIPEDSVVAERRMYNRAGIIFTISSVAGSPVINVGTPSDINALNSAASGYISSLFGITSEQRKPVYDKREGQYVAMTTLNMANFKTMLETNNTLRSAYNGVVYLHDTTNGGDGNAIRVINATQLPTLTDSSGAYIGLSLATNNGLYLQGSFNSNPTDKDHPSTWVPAAVMADAVTVLSDVWDDANSTLSLENRVVPEGQEVEIRAGILTGNTPSATSANSGGVQNLVRHLENWWTAGGTKVTVGGSIGMLYRSRFFNSLYRGTNEFITDEFGSDRVYLMPGERAIIYDERLAITPPPRAPTTTRFYRGDYYTW